MTDADPSLNLRAAEVSAAVPPPTREVSITGMPRRVRLGGAREAAATTVAAAPDDVVRVEHENGIVLWTRADDLLREKGERVAGRAAGDVPTWSIDPAPRPGLTQREGAVGERGLERGALGLGIKALEFFGVDLKKKSAALFGRTFEERKLKGRMPGLYRCRLEPGGAARAGGRRRVAGGPADPRLPARHDVEPDRQLRRPLVGGRRRDRAGRRGGAPCARGALRRRRLCVRAPHADREPDPERARRSPAGCRQAPSSTSSRIRAVGWSAS